MDADVCEFYEERAGILQFCAGLPKERAEALAKAEAQGFQASRDKAARDKVNT